MSTAPLFLNEPNLSVAWAKAFAAGLQPGLRGLAPLVVNVTAGRGLPPEVPGIRALLDATLHANGFANCHTVANTIFPQNLWKRSTNRQELYARYRAIVPRIKRRNAANRYGLYFERMTQFGPGVPQGGNQLEHLIDIWQANVRRPSAFQLNIFDPARDHTRQPRRGFPCLQHVYFTPLRTDKLALGAIYPSEYLFERAYGNYLGLYRLGRFVAHELGMELSQLTYLIGIALPGDATKTVMRALAAAVTPHLQQLGNRHAAPAPVGACP